MTKAEFMKRKDVPQFIKDLVNDLPEDGNISFTGMEIGKKPTKEDACKCCDSCEDVYKNGVSLAPILDNLGDSLAGLVEFTDCKGNVRKEDLPRIKSTVLALQGNIMALLMAVEPANTGVIK